MSDDHPGPSGSKRWLERIFSSFSSTKQPADREELLETLRAAQRGNLFDHDALSMIEGVLEVSTMQVRDIMIPRAQLDFVQEDDSLEEMLPVIIKSGHSRFPVFSEDRGTVVGILLAKDLLRYLEPGANIPFVLEDIMRPAVFVPESKRLNVLLKEFRDSQNHMAIIVDEYGAAAGLVTIEDVLEQIVGDIEDEHDTDEIGLNILARGNRRFTIKALTPVEDFNSFFNADFDEEKFDTVGGVVTNAFGHVPHRDESVTIGSFQFRVVKADSRRIHLLELSISQPASLQ
jgi:magnesium and cobalt transporter